MIDARNADLSRYLLQVTPVARRSIGAGLVFAALVWIVTHFINTPTIVAHVLSYAALVATLVVLARQCSRLTTQVEESEELFCQTAESLDGCAIFTLDTDGLISSWNNAARTMLGRETTEAIGHPIESLFASADIAALISNAVDTARESGWGTVRLQLDSQTSVRPLLRLTVGALQGHETLSGFLVTLREEPTVKILNADLVEELPTARAFDARATCTQSPPASMRADNWTNDPDVSDTVRLLRNVDASAWRFEDPRQTAIARGSEDLLSNKPFPGADASESMRRPSTLLQNSQARALFVEMAASQPSC